MTAPRDRTDSTNRRNLLMIIGGVLVAAAGVIVIVLFVDDDADDQTDVSGGGEATISTTTSVTSTSASGSPADAEVTAAQQALADIGCFTGDVDGIAAASTEQAVRDFQTAWGLDVDGMLTPATIQAIDAASADGLAVCVDDGGSDVMSAHLATSDGLEQTLDVVSCSYDGDLALELRAQTETSDLTISTAGGRLTAIYNSSTGNREGTVESVAGSATVTVTGRLTVTDDSAEPATFELVAECGG